MVAAHPYRRQMPWNVKEEDYRGPGARVCNTAYGHCVALERINGAGRSENTSRRGCATHMRVPGMAGSDAHAINDIGKCATEFINTSRASKTWSKSCARAARPVSLVGEGVLTAG
jgi:hypothetical protein